MRKLLFTVLISACAILSATAQLTNFTVICQQRNSNNTQTVTTFIQTAPNTNRFALMDGSDRGLKVCDIGPGLTVTSLSPSNKLLSVTVDVQNAIPIDAGTVSINDTNRDVTVFMEPTGALSTLTIELPSEANSRLGQIVRLGTTESIAAMATDQAGGGGAILNPATSLVANGSCTYQKVAANTWMRLQ